MSIDVQPCAPMPNRHNLISSPDLERGQENVLASPKIVLIVDGLLRHSEHRMQADYA